MDGFESKVPVQVNDRVTIGGTDITDSLMRFACEIGPDGSWCSFQLRADVTIDNLDFPHQTVTRHLGDAATLSVSAADIDAILNAGGFGSTGGEKIHDWLRSEGLIQ